jgi:hypothetical protein
MMLERSEIEKRLEELKKGLSERGGAVIAADPQCIAIQNQIQAYSAVLNPPPNLEAEVVAAEEGE